MAHKQKEFEIIYESYKENTRYGQKNYEYDSNSKIITDDKYHDKSIMWEYHQCPDELMISNNGGDEDYIVYIGPKWEGDRYNLFINYTTIERHIFGDESMIIIVSHS